MDPRNRKKLTLNKETLRNLQDTELMQVVGGVAVAHQQQIVVSTFGACPTGSCNPCGSGITDGGSDELAQMRLGQPRPVPRDDRTLWGC